MGAFEPLIKTIACLLGFLVIVCPAVFIISRLVFLAYFTAKEKHEEGGVKDGKK